VRYVLPQTIRNTEQDVSLFFRVTQPMGKVKITAFDGEQILSAVKRQKVAPGEMEKITVKAEQLKNSKGPITVGLEVLE
jgi:hypothetical protein